MVTNEELTNAILRLEKAQEKTDEQMKKTDKQIKALSQNIDGVNKSIGLEVEEFFYSSLKKNPTIANVNFDYVYQNDKRNLRGKTQEIDILLENGNHIAVVEVKNRVSQNSIDQLDKIMDNFYYFHRDYEDYKLIGALAGKIFPKHLQTQALKKGYSVITQQGDHIEQINPK
ncbi:MAG: hypothetical protein Q9M36_10260 [Sulfurovum sp.]|nr:hypothetical protein [Sulfurovum sp.]